MANTTYNLGRVGMNVRGEYSPTIAYQPMDIVTYQNGSYMAKVATTGSAPTNTSKWDKLMQGSSDYALAAENTGVSALSAMAMLGSR